MNTAADAGTVEDLDVVEVFCSGCGAAVGYTFEDTQKRSRLFCSILCINDYPRDPMEERNATWRMMADRGVSPVRIASLYGVQHSLVYKTLGKR